MGLSVLGKGWNTCADTGIVEVRIRSKDGTRNTQFFYRRVFEILHFLPDIPVSLPIGFSESLN